MVSHTAVSSYQLRAGHRPIIRGQFIEEGHCGITDDLAKTVILLHYQEHMG